MAATLAGLLWTCGAGESNAQQTPPVEDTPQSTLQATDLLQIISPSDGAIIKPGTNLTVLVRAAPTAELSSIFLIGEQPLGFSVPTNAGPELQFALPIPAGMSTRRYQLTVVGTNQAGSNENGATAIDIDVERPDPPRSIEVEPGAIQFPSLTQIPLRVTATYADGSALNVTESSLVHYSSNDGAVATVATNGMVTALAAGATAIMVNYNANGKSQTVGVPVSVPAALAASTRSN